MSRYQYSYTMPKHEEPKPQRPNESRDQPLFCDRDQSEILEFLLKYNSHNVLFVLHRALLLRWKNRSHHLCKSLSGSFVFADIGK